MSQMENAKVQNEKAKCKIYIYFFMAQVTLFCFSNVINNKR